MARVDDLLIAAVQAIAPKPPDSASREVKRNYNEKLSNALAVALADELRQRGMKGVRPAGPGDLGLSGAERRLAGGIGAKKVDVTWATEESGLIFAASIKTILFRDGKSAAYQKNLTNRRGDLLIEAVTLHRRFPYAVLAGFLFLDIGAANDQTVRRRSTFQNAFPRLRIFTRRPDPEGREEQFERLYLLLVDANQFRPVIRAFEVNDKDNEIQLEDALDELMELIGERNFDLYDGTDGVIKKI